MPTFETDDLKASYRQDDFDDPKDQQKRLSDLLTTIWRDKVIHLIVRIERVEPSSAFKGWRIYFEE